MTTAQITKAALKILDLMGYEVWRQNQVRVPGRAFVGKVGLPDIIGYERCANGTGGKFVLCEVKNEGDKLSQDQRDLLNDAKACGCACYIATIDSKKQFELKKYESK